MDKYIILSKRIVNDLLILTVQFLLEDTSTIECDVTLFSPQTVEEVIQAIENRLFTELDKREKISTIEGIFVELPTRVEITIGTSANDLPEPSEEDLRV